jgi:hypothetical protein
MSKYEERFRASVAVRSRDITILTIDGFQYYGVLGGFQWSSKAGDDAAHQFSFTFLVLHASPTGEYTDGSSALNEFLVDKGGIAVDRKLGHRRKVAGSTGSKWMSALKGAVGFLNSQSGLTSIISEGGSAESFASAGVGAATAAYMQSGAVTGSAPLDSFLDTAVGSGFATEAAYAMATGSKVDWKKGVSTGLQAGMNALSTFVGGKMYGTGVAPGGRNDLDIASYEELEPSKWSWWLNEAMKAGYTGLRMVDRYIGPGIDGIGARDETIRVEHTPTFAEPLSSQKQALVVDDPQQLSFARTPGADIGTETLIGGISLSKGGPAYGFTPNAQDPVATYKVCVTNLPMQTHSPGQDVEEMSSGSDYGPIRPV